MVSREVDRACAPCASLKSLFRIKCWGAGENRLGRRRVGFTPASSPRIGRTPYDGGDWREGPKVEYSPREGTRADPGEYGSGVALVAIAGNTSSIYRGFQGRLGLHRSTIRCYDDTRLHRGPRLDLYASIVSRDLVDDMIQVDGLYGTS